MLVLCGLALAAATAVVVVGQGRARYSGYQHARLEVGGDSYRYLVFVPASYRAASKVPLVVVLHGCSTTASQQAVASGYAQVAEQRRFIVLYPDVDPADLAHGGCWKGIWDPGAEGRGRGDAGAIAAMTRAVVGTWRIDLGRVYVIGISAGGFESSILGASYPDVYALDFNQVTTAGTYTITVTGPAAATSPAFRIDASMSLYAGALANSLSFYQT